MKPNELRIGNYVNWINTQEPHSLYLIEEIRELNYHDCFVPIPLNEEWLLKFNFCEQTKSAGNRWSFYNGVKWFELYDLYDEQDNLIGKFYYKFDDEIKYVHQLQNLYFALTGEELQIKK